MARFRMETVIATPIEKVWDFHADVGNLIRVLPVEMCPQVLKLYERFEPGAEFVLRWSFGYWYPQWHGRIVEVDPPRRFTDEQVSGPFAEFAHEHRFEPVPDDCTRLIETLEYRLPWGPLGRLADALLYRGQIRAMFSFRRQALPRVLES